MTSTRLGSATTLTRSDSTNRDESASAPRMSYEAEQLVIEHLDLVGYAVASVLRRVPSSVTRDELVSAGNHALVLAARDYDSSTGVPFSRYASVRIRGAVIDELRGMDWATRGARSRARELQDATERLIASLHRNPTREELANSLGTTVEQVDQARMDLDRRVLSLDGAKFPIAQQVMCESPSPEAQVIAKERLTYLKAGINALTPKLRAVIEALYFEGCAVADVANNLGVSQSRISQLRSEALGLIRNAMSHALDSTLVEREGEGVAARRREAYYATVAALAAGGMRAAVAAGPGAVSAKVA